MRSHWVLVPSEWGGFRAYFNAERVYADNLYKITMGSIGSSIKPFFVRTIDEAKAKIIEAYS